MLRYPCFPFAVLHAVDVGTRGALYPDMQHLKSRFLAVLGYVCAAGESPAQAFDRLRVTNPDAFPVPRCNESFLDACADEAEARTLRSAR